MHESANGFCVVGRGQWLAFYFLGKDIAKWHKITPEVSFHGILSKKNIFNATLKPLCQLTFQNLKVSRFVSLELD